jgi:glycosyltransferase involved in cell wall biosynthesis
MYSILMSVYYNDTVTAVCDVLSDMFGQTMPFDQFVIVVDGPIKDDLANKLSSIKDERINILWLQENVGLGDALNKGMDVVRNRLVMRMDADDRCSLVRAETLYQEWDNSDKIGAVGSYIGEFNDDHRCCHRKIVYPDKVKAEDNYFYLRDPIGHASVMFDKAVVEAAGGYMSCPYFEDTYLWLRMIKAGYGFRTVKQTLYFAKIGDGFHERRAGLSYLKLEIKNLTLFRRQGLISLGSYCFNVIVRPPIRLLPYGVFIAFYDKFLRKK